jgi:hypothetical protein
VGTALEKVAPPGQLADEALSVELEALDEALSDTLAASIAPATSKVYARNWKRFQEWAGAHGLVFLPATPQTIARYLTDLARDHAPATLAQHVSAIAGPTRRPATLPVRCSSTRRSRVFAASRAPPHQGAGHDQSRTRTALPPEHRRPGAARPWTMPSRRAQTLCKRTAALQRLQLLARPLRGCELPIQDVAGEVLGQPLFELFAGQVG